MENSGYDQGGLCRHEAPNCHRMTHLADVAMIRNPFECIPSVRKISASCSCNCPHHEWAVIPNEKHQSCCMCSTALMVYPPSSTFYFICTSGINPTITSLLVFPVSVVSGIHASIFPRFHKEKVPLVTLVFAHSIPLFSVFRNASSSIGGMVGS